MISIDDNGIIHIPVGHSLWVIDKLLREEKRLSFPLFKDYCNNQARDAGIIEESDSVDDSVCQEAFECGIERLKYLLKLNKQDGLSEYPYTSGIPHVSKTFQYQEDFRYRIFPQTKYGYKEYKKGKIPSCKIDESNCVKFIDRLLSSGKIFSTHALYSELEKEYCWVEFFVNKLTKHYKFSFEFNGCSYPFERRERFDRLVTIADKGLVLGPSAWASAMGYKPQEFERLLEESKYSGWIDNVSQLMMNVNTTKQESQGGRPRQETGDLTDSGESSRDGINGL